MQVNMADGLVTALGSAPVLRQHVSGVRKVPGGTIAELKSQDGHQASSQSEGGGWVAAAATPTDRFVQRVDVLPPAVAEGRQVLRQGATAAGPLLRWWRGRQGCCCVKEGRTQGEKRTGTADCPPMPATADLRVHVVG